MVKCSICVKDLGSFVAINNAYGGYFNGGSAPAREKVQVSGLPKGTQVVISCVAVK